MHFLKTGIWCITVTSPTFKYALQTIEEQYFGLIFIDHEENATKFTSFL